MNPSGSDAPQVVRTSEGERGQVKEEQEEVGTCEDVGSHQLVENQSEQPPEANPAGTTLRKRTNVSKRSSEEEGTMIPLKHDDLERSVVRKDQEVKPVSGKHVTEDASEITKISVIDEDHPDNRGEKGEDEADKQGSDITAIKVKVMGKQRKGNPSKAKVEDDEDHDEVEPGCGGPCGTKWKEHHFEFELDVSALQERAAERAERLAEQAKEYAEQAGRYVGKVKKAAWSVLPHNVLPEWMKDNEFLQDYHRPPMPSFKQCFRSIFRIHTETGNIWTHLLGFVLFIVLMVYFLVTSILGQAPWQKIAVYMAFFLGAITCLFCSFFFHTCACHSVKVANVCSKLDYSGITFLIVGSFVPWLYFGFYCEDVARAVYSTFIVVLGIVCLIVAMKDTFGSPKYRPFRAALFVSLGLSAVIPAIHYMIKNSLVHAIEAGAIGWMILMGVLYIGGATLYALRIPERFFPGKCDVWFQSHQFFHVLVVAAAMVHFHGLNTMAAYRQEVGECSIQEEITTADTTTLAFSY